MSVSTQDVVRVAQLANLELGDEETSAMLRDLNAVLDYFSQLNELDTTAVASLQQVVGQLMVNGETATAVQPFRADEVAPSLNRDQVLACAPDTDGVFFKVPKVIER